MHNTNFDGECHLLSEKYGYIASKVGTELEDLQDLIKNQIVKYAEYILANDKEKVIEILTDVFRSQVMCEHTTEDYQLIYRPAYIVSAIAQYGTIVLKFKRSKKDNLEETKEKCSACW